MDEQILKVSFSGHVAAAIAIANPQCGNLLRALGLRGERVDLMDMQRTARVIALCGAVVSFPIFSSPANAFSASDIITTTQKASHAVRGLIALGYHLAPALMLGLGLLVVLPVMAMLAPVILRMRRPNDATRRCKGQGNEEIADDFAGDAAGIPAHAFLEVVDGPESGSDTKFAILRDMLRIGREDDNDIRIPSPAVHRYHAAIHREHMADWHITDLSGVDGNGIRVNGQKCSDACLHDGDVIELGPGRLRFRAGFI